MVAARNGADLRNFRRATLERRLSQRIARLGLTSAEYLQRLRRDPEEPRRLVAHLTIKVSSFFRGAPLFETLRNVVVPDLRARGWPVRCWSAGCACGEEPYSLAFALQAGGVTAWSVLATDIDEEALATARAARYTRAQLEPVPAAVRAAYLREDEAGGVVVAPVTRHVTFERHDVLSARVRDAERFDLVSCRNVLIYFDRRHQPQIVRQLVQTIAPGGYLCLGEAEWPSPDMAACLEVVDRRGRVFRKRAEPGEIA